jgi:hypothetical protein
LTATFAVGLALVRAARRGGAFFAAFFLIVLVFLTVFLRLAVLVTVVFRPPDPPMALKRLRVVRGVKT